MYEGLLTLLVHQTFVKGAHILSPMKSGSCQTAIKLVHSTKHVHGKRNHLGKATFYEFFLQIQNNCDCDWMDRALDPLKIFIKCFTINCEIDICKVESA
jgi:hypothetical protein